jgi:peptidoglycan hydrolase CwlO-like protein
MSDTVSIMKKSTAKKILAVALCGVIFSVACWVLYQPVYSAERAALLADQWQVENDLTNKSKEVSILKAEVNRLQGQLSNLQSTLLEQNRIVIELNIKYYDLKSQVTLANQTVSDLNNQLAEAQSTIEELLEISPTPTIR